MPQCASGPLSVYVCMCVYMNMYAHECVCQSVYALCMCVHTHSLCICVYMHILVHMHEYRGMCVCGCQHVFMVLIDADVVGKLDWGGNSSVGSVLGSLFCVMQCCGFSPPLSFR